MLGEMMQKMQAKEGKIHDGFEERDAKLEDMVGNLFVAEYRISRLRDRMTNDGVATRTINMFLGHGVPKDESRFTFKYNNNNGKVYRVSIDIHRTNRTDDSNV
jgi:hypothetical protein